MRHNLGQPKAIQYSAQAFARAVEVGASEIYDLQFSGRAAWTWGPSDTPGRTGKIWEDGEKEEGQVEGPIISEMQKCAAFKGCLGLPKWLSGKESTCQSRRCRRHRFDPRVGKIPWRRKWQPTPVFLPGEFHNRGAWWTAVHEVAESQTCLSTHRGGISQPSFSCGATGLCQGFLYFRVLRPLDTLKNYLTCQRIFSLCE